MPISGMHHAMLTVSDLERSTGFYQRVLGMKRLRAIPDDGVVGEKVIFLSPDGNFFGIVEHSGDDRSTFDETRTGLDHISDTVPASELETWQTRLNEEGTPQPNPAPALFGELVIVIRVPDKIQVQIVCRHPRATCDHEGQG
jgi:glyoxylase I family protein